ncbi:type II CAAX endopeptidase family protein [Thalassotalea ponticola]|uniref:CPBP family intramembrane glutamic endopeptidase n=1 Tax=Thalassotalea ponticola TaxID=1523392 RepID=UPI0025B58430|nr:type II CAAX endopeptidase family protein [Thalassotalea ponticola]MDN3653245.1 type II CAAX endopeptidase family protein [Thalassotalea ponticola]
MQKIKTNQILIFTLSVLLLSSAISYLAYNADNLNISFLAVFTPSLVALILTVVNNGKNGAKSLFISQLTKRFDFKWLFFAMLLFPFLGGLAIIIHNLFGGPELSLRTTQLFPQLIVILLISLGEEFGWRGFLQPKLQKHVSVLTASLIVGSVWAIWHYPAALIGTGVPQDMSFFTFAIWVLLASIVIGWLYNKTGSVLIAIIMHSMANITFNYLPLLPEFTNQITTFYIFMICVAVLTVPFLPAINRKSVDVFSK